MLSIFNSIILLGTTVGILFISLNLAAFLLLVIISLCTYSLISNNWNKGLPPGPRGWPIVGNLFDIGDQPYQKFVEIGKIHGDVFTLYFGSQRFVIINHPKLIQDAFSKLEFCGRPLMESDLERMGGKRRGLIFAVGQKWVDLRRFILHHLKDFGLGKGTMEGIVTSEARELVQQFSKYVGQPTKLTDQFYRSLVNAIWQIVAGSRFPHDDPRFMVLQSSANSNIQAARMIGMLRFTPWLLTIWELIYGKNVQNPQPMLDFMKEVIEEHQNSRKVGEMRDLIDVFLEEMETITDPEAKKEAELDLLIIVFDMFVSSPQGPSFILTWIPILLSLYPNVQKSLQDEIDSVVGTLREVSLNDKPKMPYATALIKEVIRFTQKTSMNGANFHITTDNTELNGFKIPKDTVIIANFYHSMQNPAIFKNPDHFQPERFLSADSSMLIKYDSWMPFSTGKRVCLGKSLAMDELFLYTTSIFQRFNVKLDPAQPTPEILYEKIMFLNPTSIPVIFRERNN